MEHQFFIRQQNLKLYRRTAAQKELRRLLPHERLTSTVCIRDEACAWPRSPRGLRLGDQRLRCLRLGRTNCFRSLICDGMNTDGGYVTRIQGKCGFR